MFCAQCGNSLQSADKFCSKCGSPVMAIDKTQTANHQSASNSMPTPAATTGGSDCFIDFRIDSQPMLLPLEKIELLIDGVPYVKTFKFGAREKIKLPSGTHQFQAILKVTIIKRKSNILPLPINPGQTVLLAVNYDVITGGISLICQSFS